jgi:thymidylate synthase
LSNIFDEDINKLYNKILDDLNSKGTIKAKRRELMFYTFSLTNLDKNILFFPFAQRNWPWILREASDRIFNVKNPGKAFNYSKNWENRIEDSGYFSYHYSNRLNTQMQELLSKKKHSRDKIISVWNKSDIDLNGRQPCTIIMQPIMESDDKMSLVVYMRNNDMINIFPSDVFIHSTYFKYWAIENNIEYKNLYWVSAVAYYQKKRDELNFINRLLNSWDTNYDNLEIPTHKWTKDTTDDLKLKEHYESINLWESSSKIVLDSLNNFKTDYIRDWMKIMLLYNYKKNNDKENYKNIHNTVFNSEFRQIKNKIFTLK